MTSFLNLDAINSTQVNDIPYPYFAIKNAVVGSRLEELLNSFPDIVQGGSFPLESLELSPAYQQLVNEFSDRELKNILEKKFALDLSERPVMITARGHSRAKDGRIHTDSKSKIITLLLYLNTDWNAPTGNLRILNNGKDLGDYAEEVPAAAGTLIVFKVTDNCWHGYKRFEGQRRSLQINYVVDDSAAQRHNKLHRVSAKVKSWFRKAEN